MRGHSHVAQRCGMANFGPVLTGGGRPAILRTLIGKAEREHEGEHRVRWLARWLRTDSGLASRRAAWRAFLLAAGIGSRLRQPAADEWPERERRKGGEETRIGLVARLS